LRDIPSVKQFSIVISGYWFSLEVKWRKKSQSTDVQTLRCIVLSLKTIFQNAAVSLVYFKFIFEIQANQMPGIEI
jgi:hypothetical protein